MQPSASSKTEPSGQFLFPVIVCSLLFALALLVRLPYLGTFLTIDEVKWVEGAGQFLNALNTGNLLQTYWHFHPGITITWIEAIVLWLLWFTTQPQTDLSIYTAEQVTNLPGIIGAMRLSPVILTAVAIPGVYLLAKPLLSQPTALLAAALLAVDPFFTAHSRIVNGDAGAAILMFLSMLAFMRLWQSNSVWLSVVSGLLGGLALLTKLPSPVIIPWIGLLAIAGYWHHRSIKFWVKNLIIWGIAAALLFVLLWPAMWVHPINVLQLIYQDAFEVGEVGAGHDTFFAGQISQDPGWTFYPAAIAFRLTPITTIGLLLLAIWSVVQPKALKQFSRWVLAALVIYILYVVLAANTSPKKLDRYVMAVIPPLILLASWGIVLTAQKLRHIPEKMHIPIIVGIVTVQLVITLLVLPYYLTYYNPLLGGVDKASAQVPVGWGEGMEKAAAYLNGLPNAEQLTVSSWYSDMFHPYFIGQKASFSDDGRAQLSADYVVFYVNQIQRQKPYPGLVDYFRKNEPTFTVSADGSTTGDGTDWVEVYQAPAAQSASGAPKVEGVAQLLAYTITGNRLASNIPAQQKTPSLPDNQLAVTLYLRSLGPLPDDTTIAVALENSGTWGNWTQTETVGTWQEGNIIEWHGRLDIPADTGAGAYRLWVSFQFNDGTVIAPFPIADKDPVVILE